MYLFITTFTIPKVEHDNIYTFPKVRQAQKYTFPKVRTNFGTTKSLFTLAEKKIFMPNHERYQKYYLYLQHKHP